MNGKKSRKKNHSETSTISTGAEAEAVEPRNLSDNEKMKSEMKLSQTIQLINF